MSFITELKRRNVIRLAVFYIVAAWLIIQVADILLEAMAVPEWGMRLILIIVLLGFPVALAFSWIIELTPEGVKREKDVDRSRSITPETGRKLDIATIVVLVLVGGLVFWQQFVLTPTPSPDGVESPADVALPPQPQPQPVVKA